MSDSKYPPLALNPSVGDKNVVGQLDGDVIIPTGANLIPRSSAPALQIVANFAVAVTGIQVVADLGYFINLYLDAAKTQKIATMVLTPDETIDVNIPIGAALFIGAVDDVDIDEPLSHLAMNFLG